MGATNVNSNAISRGNLYTFEGVECVKIADNNALQTVEYDADESAENFRALVGNELAFMEEWAVNRYPILVNGYFFECVAAHVINADEDNVAFTAAYLVNSSVTLEADPISLCTFKVEDGVFSMEVTPIISA